MVSRTPPQISVIIPALDEEGCVAEALAALAGHPATVEVLLVDGGSRDRTVELAAAAASRAAARGVSFRVLSAPRGRAQQMNAGAAAARAPVLLFLHADTRLPADAVQAVRAALRDPGVVGGGFRHAFRERGPGLRLVSAASNLRARTTGTLYGDQAIFIRAATFRHLGGFRPLPVFEDADLCARMRRVGRTALLRQTVRTSARRFLRGGVLRTSWRMLRMKAAYARGRDPAGLAGDYWDPSRRGADRGSA